MDEAILQRPKALRWSQSNCVVEDEEAVTASDECWCSDGFEINCDSGKTVLATLALNWCHRKTLA
jgi:putative transposase